MNYSKYQQAIFNHVRMNILGANGDPNALVPAGPGSGKTTTIVKATQHVPPNMTCLVGSFNKHIADNLRGKVNPHSSATLNSIGWQACLGFKRGITLDANKTVNILETYFNLDDQKEAAKFWKLQGPVKRVIGLLKAGVITENLNDEINQIINYHGMDIPEIQGINFNDLTAQVYKHGLENKQFLDWDDQKLYPIIYDWPLPKFDYLMIDEAQDLSPLDIELCRRMMKGYSIFVGDEFQAIYGFRGADPFSMQKIRKAFDCIELPLSICYRCPDLVIKEIQKINPKIEGPEVNPNGRGIVEEISKARFREIVGPGDFVLCRTTSPLIKDCLKMLGDGKAAFVRGRDIGVDLIDLINKVEPGSCDIVAFDRKLTDYFNQESSKLIALKRDVALGILEDKVESLRTLMPRCADVREMRNLIKRIIPDSENGAGVIFQTIHKSKGLESKNVFLLRRDLIPHPRSTQEWQKIQERNLLLIAVSRSQHALYYVAKDIGEK